MTVVAWDGHTLAADKRCGTNFPRTVTKLYRLKDGSIAGVCGFQDRARHMIAWYEAGCQLAELPDWQKKEETSCELLIVRPDKTIWCLSEYGMPFMVEDKFHAIGSGRDFAAAAMFLGKSASEAVEVASALSATCGNGVDVLSFEER